MAYREARITEWGDPIALSAMQGRGKLTVSAGSWNIPMIEGICHCGAVRWCFDGVPEWATACNCTVCRRYGTLWAYGHENNGIELSGPTDIYAWGDRRLAFHRCRDCGCVAFWRPLNASADDRPRVGVNLRLADPVTVGSIPIAHLDGIETWTKIERATRCVADMWF